MSVILQCPVCSASFQVMPEQAGQLVACPTCEKTVSVPEDFGGIQVGAHSDETPKIVPCPECQKQFSVLPKMFGQPLACPHCEKVVQIEGGETQGTETHGGQRAPVIDTGARRKKKVIEISVPAVGKRKRKDNTARDSAPNDLMPPVKFTPQTPQADSSNPEKKPLKLPAVPTREGAKRAKQQRIDSAPTKISVTETNPTKVPLEAAERLQEQDQKMTETSVSLVDPVDRRLPPKFTAVDPEDALRLAASGRSQNKIVLPDGSGGYQRVDSRIVHVERDGQKVQLYAAPREKKERRRFVQNSIAILLGIVVLAAAFYFLLSW